MNRLRFLKLRFFVQALENYRKRNFIGNQVRGAIGNSMISLFCLKKEPRCKDCISNTDCIYSRVFKPIDRHPEFTTSPAPFVIGVAELDKEIIRRGEVLHFDITLFGERVRYVRQMMKVVEEIFHNTKWGFNKNFVLLSMVSVMEERELWKEGKDTKDEAQAVLWQDRFECNNLAEDQEMRILIEYKSPLITKNKEHQNWHFSEFIEAVFYRIAGMIDLYEDGQFILPYGMLFRKPHIEVIPSFEEEKNRMIFQGRLGKYIPYICLGEHLHIGKKTTYGFGEYRCHVL